MLFFLLLFLPVCWAAFLEPTACPRVSNEHFKLDYIVVDVGLDKSKQILKFFINAKVVNPGDMFSTDVVVSDVNATTNRYTTFHAEIDFRGKTIVNENKRFCQMLGVKNNTAFLNSPRFVADVNSTLSEKQTVDKEVDRFHKASNHTDRCPWPGLDLTSFASTNNSIEDLFYNNTGQLYSCPLYVNDSIYIYYETDISQHYPSLGSFGARFSIISNTEPAEVSTCFRLAITPTLSSRVDKFFLFGVLALLLITGLINLLTIIYSSHQESSNPFLFVASTICNEQLLKQLDATVQRIILYLQFALFTAGLNLKYPGFMQPLVGSLKWCALMGFDYLRGDHSNSLKADNVYVTLAGGGLKSLTYVSTYQAIGSNWGNFILTLVFWVCIHISAQYFFMFARYFGLKIMGRQTDGSQPFSFKRHLHFALGIIYNNFISLFGYPFIILTTFTFYISTRLQKDNPSFRSNLTQMRDLTFSPFTSIDNIFKPVVYYSFFDPRTNTTTYETTVAGFFKHFRNGTRRLNNTDIQVKKIAEKVTIPMATIVIGAILLAVWFAIALYFTFRYLISVRKWRIVTNTRISKLYISVNTLLVWSFLYHHYRPDRTFFVIIELAFMVARALIVSCVQMSGLAQICCMIVLEFTSCVLLLIIKPYYLPLSLYTTRWIIPAARLCIILLCIPFLKELNLSDRTTTMVAFAHLSIHGVVASAFIAQLLYCFITTIMSIVQRKRESQKLEMSRSTSIDSEYFTKQFEYKPVDQIMNHNLKTPEKAAMYSDSLNEITVQRQPSMNRMMHEESDTYFRSNAERVLRNVQPSRTDSDEVFTLSSNVSFSKQQEVSNKRKNNVDYTFREGDLKYKKYFVDDEIDSEMKELWESRQKRQEEASNVPRSTEASSTTSAMSPLTKIKAMFEKKQPDTPIREFKVSRPKKLVVQQTAPPNDSSSIASSSDGKSFPNTLSTGESTPQ